MPCDASVVISAAPADAAHRRDAVAVQSPAP